MLIHFLQLQLYYNMLLRESPFAFVCYCPNHRVRRVLYAWENPGVPVEEVMNDIMCCFHHPALRDESLEVHRNMFNTVRTKLIDFPSITP
jgi:hypothetical protein